MAKAKKDIFNWIAPVYGIFYRWQKQHYRRIFNSFCQNMDWHKYRKIIDIGCGTGAMTSVLSERGLLVTGVDPAAKMLQIASSKPENKQIRYIQGNVLERLPFADQHFDIAIAAYVAHGISAPERQIMYKEMNRLARYKIVFYDYNENRALLTTLVEWLEGGDYFNFICTVEDELKSFFSDVEVKQVGKRASCYICTPRKAHGTNLL